MGQGQDPYRDASGFTPYRPGATPDGEVSEDEGPSVPSVPYGGAPVVPYGGVSGSSFLAPAATVPVTRRVVPWLVALGVLLASCGGGVAAIVGTFTGDDNVSVGSSGIPPVRVNDLEAGQCLIGAGFATDEPVSNLEVVDCTKAHDVQVLDVNVLDSVEAADYVFDDPASSAKACTPVLSASQKALLQGSEYGLVAFTETGTPAVGDKVACLVKRTDNQPIHEFLPASEPE